jgi:alpha/beta superfamily hydrolase
MAGLNPQSQLLTIAGPAGPLELAIDAPQDMVPRGVVVLCHPHPLHGGTMDNKVVQTLARAFLQLGYRVARFNFRGVGASAGQYDEGRGEVDDALAVIAAVRDPVLPLALAGFSFGAYVAAAAAARCRPTRPPSAWPWSGRPPRAFRCRRCRPTPSSSTARPTTLCRCRPRWTGRGPRSCRWSSCPVWGTFSTDSCLS